MDRTSGDLTSSRPRASSCERTSSKQTQQTNLQTNKRTSSPPPPIPSRLKSNSENNKSNSDYEAISTLCLLPGTRSVCSIAPMTPTLQKIASKMTASCMSPKSVLKKRYDFHRAVEKLVQEKFVPTHASSPNSTTGKLSFMQLKFKDLSSICQILEKTFKHSFFEKNLMLQNTIKLWV